MFDPIPVLPTSPRWRNIRAPAGRDCEAFNGHSRWRQAYPVANPWYRKIIGPIFMPDGISPWYDLPIIGKRHNNGANRLWVDGHVSRHNVDELADNSSWYYPGQLP